MSPDKAHKVIWLNQRAVFDDMFDESVHRELCHWLRYNQKEKQSTGDGLAYDCMELNGNMMRWVVKYPNILRAPGIFWMLKNIYLRTMVDSSDVFYMMAPFSTESQPYAVGEQLWIFGEQ